MDQITLRLLLPSLLLFALSSFSQNAHAAKANICAPILKEFEAGVDYPTELPIPSALVGKKLLILGDSKIAVDNTVSLESPVAGVDYPTEARIPKWVKTSKILVFVPTYRLPIMIEKAKAGVDYPTDGPQSLDRNFLVWAFSSDVRVPVKMISGIEKAKAGIDYPTDAPAQEFYVIIQSDGIRRPLKR